jgi:hypothetical protein
MALHSPNLYQNDPQEEPLPSRPQSVRRAPAQFVPTLYEDPNVSAHLRQLQAAAPPVPPVPGPRLERTPLPAAYENPEVASHLRRLGAQRAPGDSRRLSAADLPREANPDPMRGGVVRVAYESDNVTAALRKLSVDPPTSPGAMHEASHYEDAHDDFRMMRSTALRSASSRAQRFTAVMVRAIVSGTTWESCLIRLSL